MEEEGCVVYPDDPDFDINKAWLSTTVPRIYTRYECVPMHFVKHVYRVHAYTQEDRLFKGRTPASILPNSSYGDLFIVGLMELRYMQSLPIEGIINYLESRGFTLKKPTAHKLIEKASDLFEGLYKCARQTVLSDPYKTADGTYYKTLVPEKNSKGKRVRKGCLWAVIGINTRMIYLLYDDDFRSERVILNELGSCKGIIRSNGYSPYRKLESDAYPNITRIPYLQHIRRKFIDCGEKSPSAKRIMELVNALCQSEYKHKVGVKEWTVEQNLMRRRKHIPGILREIKDMLSEIGERGDLLPESELQEAITYLHNEWNAVANIFNYDGTYLDNNMVGRMSRYTSSSGGNSLFSDSRKGVKRSTTLYTIALAYRIRKANLFEYLMDMMNGTAEWQSDTPIGKYREPLPDRREKANS